MKNIRMQPLKKVKSKVTKTSSNKKIKNISEKSYKTKINSKKKIESKNKKFSLVKRVKSTKKNVKSKKAISAKAKIKPKESVKKIKARKIESEKPKLKKRVKSQKVMKKTRKKIEKPLSKKTLTRKVITKKSALSLDKHPENPIIPPNPENNWEAWQTFNPGVILLDNKVHFLYRAIGSDGLSRLGYAVSSDGFNIDERFPKPVYEHNPRQHKFTIFSYFSGGSWGGCEDPRLVRVGNEDVIYMTYTACSGGLRVGLTSVKVDDFISKKWNWEAPKLISPPGEVHKNWVIFPEKIKGKYAILHSINPEISIDYVDNLEFKDMKYIQSQHSSRPAKTSKCWDNWVRGVGPTPLKTEEGWLVLYHAMDYRDPGKYKVGAMLLDLNDPTKILHRSSEPLLEPCEDYENNGFKWGVVYASGAIIKGGRLLVYYGGADSCVCVAYTNLKEFMEALKRGTSPQLKKKKLKRIINNRKK